MELINLIYQSADMGIKGIDDTLHKIKNIKLYRLIKKEKKEYQRILKKVRALASKNNVKLTEISFVAQMSSQIITDIKLLNNDSDEQIIKMMIEGTYKSLGILSSSIIEETNDKVLKLANEFIGLLNGNIKELKNI